MAWAKSGNIRGRDGSYIALDEDGAPYYDPSKIGATPLLDNDARYYTEPEVDAFLAGKANSAHGHAAADITNATAVGRSVLTAADAAAARTAIGAGTSSLVIGTTAGTAAEGTDPRLTDARTPTAHTHPTADLSDSTAVGRAVVTAADAAAARTATGAAPLASPTFTGTVTSPNIRLTSTTDASATSTDHAFQIGSTTALNIVVDNNEVLARNNGAVASLWLDQNSLVAVPAMASQTNGSAAARKDYVDGTPVTATFNANAEAFDAANWGPPEYWKIGDTVFWVGLAKLKVAVNHAAFVSIGTMPAGFRPNKRTFITCMGAVDGINRLCRIDFLATGDVRFVNDSGINFPIGAFFTTEGVYKARA